MVGWMLALSVVMAIAVAMAPDTPTTSTSTTTLLWRSPWVWRSAAYLWFRWRRTVGDDSADTLVDGSPGHHALGPGAGPRAPSCPNYFLVVAGATEMVQIGLTGAALAATAVVFVLVASLGVAAPLAVLVAKRDRAPEVYAGWRTWILANNRPVMYGMGAMIAVILVGKGLWALASTG